MGANDRIAITDWKGLAPFYGQKVGRQNGWFDRLINLSTRYGSLRYENLVQISELALYADANGHNVTVQPNFLARFLSGTVPTTILGNLYTYSADSFTLFAAQEFALGESSMLIRCIENTYLLIRTNLYVIRDANPPAGVLWIDRAGLPALDQTTYSAADDGVNGGPGKGLSPNSDYEYIVVYGRDDRAVEGTSLNFQSVLVTTSPGNDQRQVKLTFPITMLSPRTTATQFSPVDYFNIYRKNPGGDLFLYMDRQAVTWDADMDGVLNAVDYTDTFSNEEVLARSLNPPKNAAGSFISDGTYKEDKMDPTAAAVEIQSLASNGQRMFILDSFGKVYQSRFLQPEHFQRGETIPDDQPVKQAGSFRLPEEVGGNLPVHSLLQHNQVIYAGGSVGIFAAVGTNETLSFRKITSTPVAVHRGKAWLSQRGEMLWLANDGFHASSGVPGSDRRIDEGHKFFENIKAAAGLNSVYGMNCCSVDNKAYFVTNGYATSGNGKTALLCYDTNDLDAAGNGKWHEVLPTNRLFNALICADTDSSSLIYVGNNRIGAVQKWWKVFKDLDKSTHTPHVNYVSGNFWVGGPDRNFFVDAIEYSPIPAVKDVWVVTVNAGGTNFTSTLNATPSTSGATSSSPITLANGVKISWSDPLLSGNDVYTFEISSQETYRARCISYWVLDALDWKKNSPMKLMVNWRKLAGANGFGSANGKSKIQVNVYGKKLDSAAHQYSSFVLYDTNEVSLPADKYDGIYYQDIKNGFEFESADWNYEVEQLHIEVAFLAAGSSPTDDFVVDSIYLENKDRERTPGRTSGSLG